MLLTLQEVAVRCGISVATVRRWVRTGELEHVDLGARSKRVRAEALAVYLERKTRPALPAADARPVVQAIRVVKTSNPAAATSSAGRERHGKGKRGPRIRAVPASL